MAQGSIRFLSDKDGDFSLPASHGGVNSFRLFVLFTPPPKLGTLSIENFTATPVGTGNLNFTPILSRLEQDSTNEGIWSFSLTPNNGKATIQLGLRVDGITDINGNGYSTNSFQQIQIHYRPPSPRSLIAEAGPPQNNVASEATVRLDGTGSTLTGGGRKVTYLWARTGGSAGGTVTLTDATTLAPSFTADTLNPGDADVEHIITLTVMDDQGSTDATDTVKITVKAPRRFTALFAVAGPPQNNVASEATVRLDGTGSTLTGGGRKVTYLWARTGGSAGGTVTLTDATTLAPSFTADTLNPGDADVEHIITLTVMDDQGSTDATDTVKITVKAPRRFTALFAEAGPPQNNVASEATVRLDGTGSTLTGGGRDVTYLWARTGGSAGGTVTLTDATTLAPSFTADTLNPGDADVEHIITLTVMDDQGSTDATDTVKITVKAPRRFTALFAEAGPPQNNVASEATVRLDGTGSTLTGGGRDVTYLWARTGGSAGGTVTLTGATTLAPSFTADTLTAGDDDVEHIITLRVMDNQGTREATDTVKITVKAPRRFADPVANAGPSQTVASGATVTLDGSKSTKDDRRTIGYLWARTDGTPGKSVTLTGSNTAEPSFTADILEPEDPDVIHVFTLTVTDDAGETDTDTVTVTVTAVMVDILVNPPDLTVQEGGSGTYQVSLSESPRRKVSVIAFPDHEDVVLDNVRLVFNAENWDTRQNVRINTVADADKEDDIARIRHRLVANGVALGQAGIVTVRVRDEDPILRPIGNYLASRATALLNNQPDLIRFLKQDETTQGGNFTLKATEGRLVMDGRFVHDGVWGEVTGSYGNSDSGDTKSVLGSFAFHRKYSENLLVGAMLQFDFSDHNLARNNGRIDGIGWLVGPYFVARHWSQPLYFEGRLFYGDSGNDIRFIDRDLGVRTGSFDTTRLLAQIRVEGEIALSDLDEGLRLIPYADARWIEDRAKAFTDRIGNRIVNRVPGQKISTGQLELGSNVEIPVAVNHGEMTLTGGLGLVYANTEGDYITSDSRGRGRGEIGFSYGLDNNVWIDFESFYDGIGSSRYESYGLSLSAEMKF